MNNKIYEKVNTTRAQDISVILGNCAALVKFLLKEPHIYFFAKLPWIILSSMKSNHNTGMLLLL